MLKSIALSIGILFAGGTTDSNDSIICEVQPLETYGFSPLYEGVYEERVCSNIIDYTDFTIVHIDELDNATNGSILSVEINEHEEVTNMKLIKE